MNITFKNYFQIKTIFFNSYFLINKYLQINLCKISSKWIEPESESGVVFNGADATLTVQMHSHEDFHKTVGPTN